MQTDLRHQNRIFMVLSEGENYTQVILSNKHPDIVDSQYFDTQPQVSFYGSDKKQLFGMIALRTALVAAGFEVIDC